MVFSLLVHLARTFTREWMGGLQARAMRKVSRPVQAVSGCRWPPLGAAGMQQKRQERRMLYSRQECSRSVAPGGFKQHASREGAPG